MIIFKAHRKYGNKWADISKYLVGRTDNSIKNHFYSTLRKSLRRINKYLGDKNSNTSLIKNCRLSSQNQGLLEEINEVNVLTTNLKQMQESRSERLGNSYKSLNQVYDKNQQKWNIFREFNATGAASSRETIARVPIMLSELFGLGRVQALDLRKTGDLRVEVELDISQISAEIIGDGDAVETDPEPLVGDGAPITTLNVFGYEVLDDSPFWVGQKVKYTSGTITTPTKPDVETYTTIKSITRTSGGSSNVLDQLTIEFNDALDTMAVGQEATNPQLTPQVLDVDGNANTVSVKFDQVEMVLHQLLDNTPRNEDILYLTYDTEQRISAVLSVTFPTPPYINQVPGN